MFSTYVALGDSSTEGLDDPTGPGGAYRGWADRLAEHVEAAQPGLRYANLAVRGRLVGQVEQEQLAPALALQPDLATVFAGVNDLLRRSYDADEVVASLERVMTALVAQGATVLTITAPDLSPVMPVARLLRLRLLQHNARVREAARRAGAICVDVAGTPLAADPCMWSADRLHASSTGHAHIAAALADAIGVAHPVLPAPVPQPPRGPAAVVAAELAWTRQHLLPWLHRRWRGASSGDAVLPKRPEPLPVELPA